MLFMLEAKISNVIRSAVGNQEPQMGASFHFIKEGKREQENIYDVKNRGCGRQVLRVIFKEKEAQTYFSTS